jgi:hypothetical protein
MARGTGDTAFHERKASRLQSLREYACCRCVVQRSILFPQSAERKKTSACGRACTVARTGVCLPPGQSAVCEAAAVPRLGCLPCLLRRPWLNFPLA